MEKSINDLTSNLEAKINEMKENSPKIMERLRKLQAFITNKIDRKIKFKNIPLSSLV